MNNKNALLGRILWLSCFFLLLFLAHSTNPNQLLIGNWVNASNELLGFQAPSDNWYGPTAAFLMIPFVDVQNLFIATLVFGLVGANFYWLITRRVENFKFRLLARLLLLSNFYLFRLLDSSGDSIFEFFLLMIFIYGILEKKWWLFNLMGIMLGELRSAYWVIYLGLSFVFLVSSKSSVVKRIRFAIALPSLILVLFLNHSIYGVFSTAGEGGYTAFFTNNKSSYITGNSFMVDHFSFGEAGPMTRRCEDLYPCNDRQLFLKTIKENIDNPQAFGFNLLQKFSIYFFEPQKVPRIPGEFFLHEKEGFIEIGEQRLTTFNFLASLNYFLYRACILISVWFLITSFVFGGKKVRSIFYRNPLVFCLFPWLLGSVTGVLFVAETRHWIMNELILVPFVLSVMPAVLSQLRK